MWYGQVVYIRRTDKYMSDDTEKIHNKSIDMIYLRKRYMNISPTGHNVSFTECQNLSHSVLLGFIFPWNIFITTQYSGWGFSCVFINPQSLIIQTKTMLCYNIFRI